MEIDLLIHELQLLQGEGVTRIFVLDATRNITLDLIDVQIDEDGDGQLLAD